MQRSLLTVVRVAPLWLSYSLMSLAIPFYVLFDGRGRKASYRFFRKRMGYGAVHSFFCVFRNMYSMGTVVIDRFSAYAGKRFRMIPDGKESFDRLAQTPGSFMMLGSHLGNFEMVGYMLPSPRPLKVLVYGGETHTVMQNRTRMFAPGNIEMIPATEDMAHLFALNNAMAGGEIVSLPADRLLGSHKVFRLPFLGADAAFPQGPFTLAALRDVPVVATFVVRESRGSYRLVVRRLPMPQEGTSARRAQALAGAYVSLLESMARRYPEQWYNFYDFWSE